MSGKWAALVVLAGCAGARTEISRAPVAVDAGARVSESIPFDAKASDAAIDASDDASIADAAVDVSADTNARSPLATLFDGAPDVPLVASRCAPGCLRYPKGWLATDDAGIVYTWFFVGEGRFATAEVTRSSVGKLDESALALRVRLAGGTGVTWSEPVDAAIGGEHLHAVVAEGKGRAHGQRARFWYAFVEVGARRDLIVAWVVEGAVAEREREREAVAVVRSVSTIDGRAPER
jgi:hypothetical protein